MGDFGFRERLKHRSMGFLDNRSSVPQDERLSSESRFFLGGHLMMIPRICVQRLLSFPSVFVWFLS